MGRRTIANPYCNNDALVEKFIGTAYDVVRHVEANLDFLKSLMTVGGIRNYPDVETGLAATTEGEYFAVHDEVNPDIFTNLYKKADGEAVLVSQYPSVLWVQTELATAAATNNTAITEFETSVTQQLANAATANAAAIQAVDTHAAQYGTALSMTAVAVPAYKNYISTTGYSVFGDAGFGTYKRVTAQPAHTGRFRTTDRFMPDGTTDANNGGWWEYVPSNGIINPMVFGADPTGLTFSDTAFAGAFTMLTSYRTVWDYADPLSKHIIRCPPGQYTFSGSEPIMPSTYTTKSSGFVLEGLHYANTALIFAPTSGSKVMIYNQAFLFCLVRNITVVGTGRDQTFYRADMTSNNQQGWSFERVRYLGLWGKGHHLTGTNNNSEMSWVECRGGGGEMGQFLYTPPASASPSGSDQFLNYRFHRCDMGFAAAASGTAGTFTGSITGNVLTVTTAPSGVIAAGNTIATPAGTNLFSNRITGQTDRIVVLSQLTGTAGGIGTYQLNGATGTIASTTLANLTNDLNSVIDMATGGHISFIDCDFSGYQSGSLFQLRGTSHAYGVCSFSAINCRYEFKSVNTNYGFSEWNQGMFTPTQDDMSSQANVYYKSDGTLPIVQYINNQNTGGPQFIYKNSQIIGLISIGHGTNDFEVRRSIKFENCDHMQLIDPYDMLVWPASTNDYGAPFVEFSGVRGKAGRVSTNTSWAASTAYAVGAIVRSNSGNSLYTCTTAGTSGSAAAVITGSISGTTLTVVSSVSGTLSIGQKLTGVSTANITVTLTTGQNTAVMTSLNSGAVEIGQYTNAAGIPNNSTITAITVSGGTTTLTFSNNATSSGSQTFDTNAASPILEDTIITAGSGTSWTVSRSHSTTAAATTRTINLVGGPQSAAPSIPDGTAVWAYTANEGRDYFNDGIAISPNFTGMSNRPATKKRIAEFGGTLPAYGSANIEVIIPPNAIITGAGIYTPSQANGGTSSSKPADYLIECDDGTIILAGYGQNGQNGLKATASGLFIPVGTDKQKRKIKFVPGGSGGGKPDQVINKGRAWIEYLA